MRAYIRTRGFSTYAERAQWGREQQMIDSHGGYVPNNGYLQNLTNSTNSRREVGKKNILGYMYWLTSNDAFGPLWQYTGEQWTEAFGFVWQFDKEKTIEVGVLP